MRKNSLFVIAFLSYCFCFQPAIAQSNKDLVTAWDQISSITKKVGKSNLELIQYNEISREEGLQDIINVFAGYMTEFDCDIKTLGILTYVPIEKRPEASKLLCTTWKTDELLKMLRRRFDSGYAMLRTEAALHKADNAKELLDEADRVRSRLKRFYCNGKWQN